MPPTHFQVCVSYAADDAEFVHALVRRLHAERDLHVSLDPWTFAPDQEQHPELPCELGRSRAWLICAGPRTPYGWFLERLARGWAARQENPALRTIPLLLPGVPDPCVAAMRHQPPALAGLDLRRGLGGREALHRLLCMIVGAAAEAGRLGLESLAAGDEPPEPGPLPPGSRVPYPRNACFTGRRRELARVARALLIEARPALLVIAAGEENDSPGKTELAVEFAYRYGRFFAGVHWIDAAWPRGIAAQVAACGAAMDLAHWPHGQPARVEQTLAAWQSSIHECRSPAADGSPGPPRIQVDDRPRLVILDHAEVQEATREWLERLAGGAVRALITTRHSRWGVELGIETLPLERLAPAEGMALLHKLLPAERAEDERLGALAAFLGYHPLALNLAGRYLARHAALPVDVYRTRMYETAFAPLPGESVEVAHAFAVSWAEVVQRRAGPLLAAAGLCAPDEPIPCELLRQAIAPPPARGLLKPLAALLRPSRPPVDRAAGLLVELGLLRHAVERAPPHEGPATLSLLAQPRIAALARRVWAQEEGRGGRLLGRTTDAAARLAREANDARDRTGDDAALVDLLPHLHAIGEAAYLAEYEDTGNLWINVGYYCRGVADLTGARHAYQRALDIDQRIFGAHPEVARDAHLLAEVLHALGQLEEARLLHQRVLDILERTLGPQHPNVATIHNDLGAVLRDLGRLDEARRAFERALEIDERAFGGGLEPAQTARIAVDVNHMGSVLYAQGDLDGARRCFQRALEIDERTFGPNHPQVATDLNNLGAVLRDLGDPARARLAFERAIEIDARTLVTNDRPPSGALDAAQGDPVLAIRLTNLGNVLRDLGQLDRARQAHARALEIDECALGSDHPRVAIDLNNLGTVLRDLGDLAGARHTFQRALDLVEHAPASQVSDLAALLNNLGSVLHDLDDLDGARKVFVRALRLLERQLGSDHPDVAPLLNNLGSVLHDLEDLAGARQAFQDALDVLEETLGPDHPNVATAINNLGSVLQDTGDLEGARQSFQRAFEIDQAALGTYHVKVATDLNNLGSVLSVQGNPQAARQAYLRALEILERCLPAGHRTVRVVQRNLERLGG